MSILSKKVKSWFKRVWLFPLFLILGVEGGEGGDGGDGGSEGGNTILTGGEGASSGSSSVEGGEGESSSTSGEAAGGQEGSEGSGEGDGKGGEGKEGEEGKEKEGEKKEGAPEEYADFTVPEGLTLDAEALADFKPIAKELNLTQEQAQKLVDIQAKAMQKMHTDRMEQWNTTLQGWADEVKADKELGGDKFKTTVEVAQRALNTFGTPELKKALNEYGLGNHPEMVRLMFKIGSAMREDSIVTGGKGGNGDRDTSIEGRASRMYGTKG